MAVSLRMSNDSEDFEQPIQDDRRYGNMLDWVRETYELNMRIGQGGCCGSRTGGVMFYNMTDTKKQMKLVEDLTAFLGWI